MCGHDSRTAPRLEESHRAEGIKIYESSRSLKQGEIWSSHVTLTANQQAECKALGRLCQVAQTSGVVSDGIGQGAQEVICQVSATFPKGGALGFCKHLVQ